MVKVEEDWEEIEGWEEKNNEEEIEKIEEEIDEICSKATHENCPEEICGDMCEIWEEENLEEDEM